MTVRGPRAAAYLRWLLRARPGDYVLALSEAGASLPMVGKHLEPLGGMTAMSIWGARLAPEFVRRDRSIQNSAGDQDAERRRDREITHAVSVAALRGVVSAADLELDWPTAQKTPPILDVLRQRRYLHRRAVHYGDHPAQVLDVWRRKDPPAGPAPVLIFVPGGAWVHGRSMLQGSALMSRMAELGWVCLAIDYRVSPHHRWPRHIIDVKTASHGRAPTSTSSAVTAISLRWRAVGPVAACRPWPGSPPATRSTRPRLPEGADSSVDAVVGIYGRYDWEDRSTRERAQFVEFLERVVVKRTIARHPEVFRDASPIARAHRNAPPFMVIHGSKDNVIPVEQARSFVERMRATSHSMVGYLELPGAGHGFDLIDGERAGVAAHATSLFLNQVYRTKAPIGAKEVI